MEVILANKGGDIKDPESMGIIPRVMDRIFEMIEKADENIEFALKVSMLEIYNEKIQDLLNPVNNNLKIKEGKEGVFVDDCTELYVSSSNEMRDIMLMGSQNRTIAATRMNERSSRSHSIFVMTLTQKDLSSGTTKTSRIYFVDLAGSEKVAKTDVRGKQLEEAKNINKSLTALGMVINTLAEAKKNAHVPYRDSKLTRLLQDSLGGNSMTTLLIACSMCSYNDKETLSTLRFGQRAKSIKNKPKENVERSARELQALLEQANTKIAVLEKNVVVLRSELTKNGYDKDQLSSLIDAEIEDELLSNREEHPMIKESPTSYNLEHGGTLQGNSNDNLKELNDNLTNLESNVKPSETTEEDILGLDDKNKQEEPKEVSNVPNKLPFLKNFKLKSNKEAAPGTPAGSPKDQTELLKKIKKLEDKVMDLTESLDMVNTEIEDLTIENMDFKEKYDALVKGGIGIISRYHRELLKINLSVEHNMSKIQHQWIQYSHLLENLEELKDWVSETAEIIDSNSKFSKCSLPQDLLSTNKCKMLKTFGSKDVLLSSLLENIQQAIEQSVESSPVKLSIRDYGIKIDNGLLNLQRSITAFQQCFLTGSDDPLDPNSALLQKAAEETDTATQVDDSTQQTADDELDQEISTPKEFNLDDLDEDNEERVTKLRRLLDESHQQSEKQRQKIKQLKSQLENSKQIAKKEYEEWSIQTLNKHNHEISEQEQVVADLNEKMQGVEEELAKANRIIQDLNSELENITKRGVSGEMSTPRGMVSKQPQQLDPSVLNEDAQTIIRRINRYRNERNKAEQHAKELRAQLLKNEEYLQAEIEKNTVLKKTIRDQEDEIRSYKREIDSKGIKVSIGKDNLRSNAVKTLRGGTKNQDNYLNIGPNLFTSYLEEGMEEGEEEFSEAEEEMYEEEDYQEQEEGPSTPTK